MCSLFRAEGFEEGGGSLRDPHYSNIYIERVLQGTPYRDFYYRILYRVV